MMVEILEDVNTRHVRTPIPEENVNKALDEFENEVDEVFPQVGDTLVEFLKRKKDRDINFMLCTLWSVVFNRFVARALESFEIQTNFSTSQGSMT